MLRHGYRNRLLHHRVRCNQTMRNSGRIEHTNIFFGNVRHIVLVQTGLLRHHFNDLVVVARHVQSIRQTLAQLRPPLPNSRLMVMIFIPKSSLK